MTDVLARAIAQVAAIEQAHAAAVPNLEACSDDFTAWRRKLDAANAATVSAVAAIGGLVKHDWRGASVRVAGIRSTSTGGVAGALRNWLAAARQKNVA